VHEEEKQMPGRPTDAEREKANALRLLGEAREKVDRAHREMKAAMRGAREHGATFREIAELADLPLASVRQLLGGSPLRAVDSTDQ
jgi:hypothetical protein